MLFTHALKREAAIILQSSPEVIVQRMVAGRHALVPGNYLEPVGRLRGVSEQRGRLWGYFYDAGEIATVDLIVAVVPYGRPPPLADELRHSRSNAVRSGLPHRRGGLASGCGRGGAVRNGSVTWLMQPNRS